MMIYDKIVEDLHEPQSTSVLWLRPTGDGFSFYRYRNGHWEALKIMDDKGSASPDDDTEVDVSDIPSMDHIEEIVKEEITEQITDHDVKVGDVHYAPSSDHGEYPDYSDII